VLVVAADAQAGLDAAMATTVTQAISSWDVPQIRFIRFDSMRVRCYARTYGLEYYAEAGTLSSPCSYRLQALLVRREPKARPD
jgi:hypothetical protein